MFSLALISAVRFSMRVAECFTVASFRLSLIVSECFCE